MQQLSAGYGLDIVSPPRCVVAVDHIAAIEPPEVQPNDPLVSWNRDLEFICKSGLQDAKSCTRQKENALSHGLSPLFLQFYLIKDGVFICDLLPIDAVVVIIVFQKPDTLPERKFVRPTTLMIRVRSTEAMSTPLRRSVTFIEGQKDSVRGVPMIGDSLSRDALRRLHQVEVFHDAIAPWRHKSVFSLRDKCG
jgi:hypothetical protein